MTLFYFALGLFFYSISHELFWGFVAVLLVLDLKER